MFRLATTLVVLFMTYAAAWAVWYRIPAPQPNVLADLRTPGAAHWKCVTFCGSLASNPHGFPGHAYIAWSDGPPVDFAAVESTGYVPLRACDQIPSLVSNVRGCIVNHASAGNQRSLNTLSVLVDADKFDHAKRLSRRWSSDVFRVGVRDCVRYSDTIARDLGLKTPSAAYRFPQDYIRELKALNSGE